MVAFAMFTLLGGICCFCLAGCLPSGGKSFGTGGVFLFLSGLCGGVFATPSRGMPNGFPGAKEFCFILFAIGLIMLVKEFIPAFAKKENSKKSKSKVSLPLIIAGLIFVIFIVVAFTSSSGSSSSTPWKDLGVSEREYMEVYNYFKYGK